MEGREHSLESDRPEHNENGAELEPTQSSGSTVLDVDMEQENHEMDSIPSSSPPTHEPDPRNSLQHVLGYDSPQMLGDRFDDTANSEAATPSKSQRNWGLDDPRDTTEDDGDDSAPDNRELTPSQGATALSQGAGGKRTAANGATSSVYGGNKIKHLKREDGVPLWRKDIQYDFLRAVFEDPTPAFTRVKDGSSGHTFADIYIDAMAESRKTSKILKDKLLSDRTAALNMAMVCLLVNVGRMNTTLNFFPEMRAALRTYHAIPCLQVQEDSNAYKQLQDAPRLKSILKGACEDKQEPYTIEAIKEASVPRTNPVNLIFVLAQYAPKITELHFSLQLDFFHLVTRTTLSSQSRAKGFLWLMWWYLESDFSSDSAAKNPFGPGQPPEVNDVPQKLPPFEHLTEEQARSENIDTDEEVAYGRRKQEDRKRINESEAAAKRANDTDDATFAISKKGKKNINPSFASEEREYSSAHERASPNPAIPPHKNSSRTKPRKSTLDPSQFEADQMRSASPPGIYLDLESGAGTPSNGARSQTLNGNGQSGTGDQSAQRTGRGRWPRNKEENLGQRIILRTKMNRVAAGSPGAPGSGSGQMLLQPDGSHQRSRRPLTAHQIAVEQNRQARVEHKLDRRLQAIYRKRRRARERDGAIWRAWNRQEKSTDPFENSEDEENSTGTSNSNQNSTTNYRHPLVDLNGIPFRNRPRFGGLVAADEEEEDFGEELGTYAAAVRRAARRLDRWDSLPPDVGGVMGTKAKKRTPAARPKRGTKKRGGVGGGDDDDGDGDPTTRQLEDGNSPGGSHLETLAEADGADEETDEDLDEIDRELLRDVDHEGEIEVEGEGEGEGEVEGIES
ncbi:MAG: hypothetical protein M1837_000947 [Sclerophora amabilis]|nr:MAG: hypothetical protein M1837_000947 [Sclerophora amabilis]